jgi:hypothetical protein
MSGADQAGQAADIAIAASSASADLRRRSNAVSKHDHERQTATMGQAAAGPAGERARGSIERLRQDLDQLDPNDEAVRADLELLIASIESHLDLPGQPPAPTALLDGIKSRLRQFEVQHPRLMASLEQVLGALSSSGI